MGVARAGGWPRPAPSPAFVDVSAPATPTQPSPSKGEGEEGDGPAADVGSRIRSSAGPCVSNFRSGLADERITVARSSITERYVSSVRMNS